MKIIVAGAAGFLGSHLCQHHLEQGDSVVGIDDFCTSNWLDDNEHLLRLKHHNNFSFIMNSIENNVLYERLLKFHRDVDVIYNFACPASPVQYQRMPIKTIVTCTLGTKNMLDFALNTNAKIVHASTSEVYGDPEESPQHESYRGNVNTWGDRANYDEGKRLSETLCYEYMKLGVDVRVVRIFNTYGENMRPDDGRVITNFIKQALNNEHITIFGGGEQTRSFCYVSDLIDGIIKLQEIEQNPGQPINIGNPREFTIEELASIVIKKCNSTSKLEFKPLPMDDPKHRKPDIKKARALLGWEPKVSLDEGVERMIKYMRRLQ